MNNLLAIYNSLFDFLNDINKQYHELDAIEKSFDNQLQFLRSYVDRMMKGKLGVQSKSSNEEIIHPSDRIINFNVGGTIFAVSVGVLSQIPESMLWSGYVSGRWRAENHELDDDGNILLDHDPSNFATLISLLRLKSMVAISQIDKMSHKILEIYDAEEMTIFKRYLDYSQIGLGLVGIFSTSINMSGLEVSSFLDHMSVPPNKLSLVFRGSRDGFTATAFHAKCDGIDETVTIVRDTDGSVFGGYADVAWRSFPCYVYCKKSFLFSISIRGAVYYEGCKFPKHSEKPDGGYMAAFGNGLVISEGCNENTLSSADFDDLFKNNKSGPYLMPEASSNFQVAEIEVWHFVG